MADLVHLPNHSTCCALSTELKRKSDAIDFLKEMVSEKKEEIALLKADAASKDAQIASLKKEAQELRGRLAIKEVPPKVQALFAKYSWFRDVYSILLKHKIITIEEDHLSLNCAQPYTVLAQMFWYGVKGDDERCKERVQWSVIMPAFNVPNFINLSNKAGNSNTYVKCREYKKLEALIKEERGIAKAV